ncbi:S-layer homology domain-containing protein [Paenibacillus sp. GSMTC-2017]|uniref:S-layer homology domain-containing protein n=1 Tax=Paenibacillus sp. GSMTC-2017 TaxID=2794350 RepID=UPI0018D9C544|nr:S-layer homology domain-containing protein [Paenibacillus sp. GSMTC-2017]MBH5318257.1 S-layer homology domain-containing protein [Paenibacillus sp. GSMTC-2017]
MTSVKSKGSKWVVALLTTFTILFTASNMSAAPLATQEGVIGAAEYKLFLEDKFDLNLTGKVTKGDFIEAVASVLDYEAKEKKVVFSDIKAEDPLYDAAAALYEQGILKGPAIGGDQVLTNAAAISIAVRAANLEELAYTYPADKVEDVFSDLKLKSAGLGKHVAQEIAAAVDTGVLPASYYSNGLQPKAAVSEDLANVLIGKILETKGLYKNYIGFVSDGDIISKLNQAYATSDIIDAPKLQKLVNTALEQKLITGYNIKDARFESNFVDSLSLTYGHSDLTHAIQLIGLLRSEGLDAKVQFEPKTSAYVHLKEWGDPGPNVVQITNGNFIAFAKEYDLEFEFLTAADKVAFQNVIFAYAKKNEENQSGLIAGSWWQPLYFSATEIKDYEIITNNLITDANSPYVVHAFSLNAESEKVVKGFKSIDPEAKITPYQFWVDVPFFNYLHGESK